MALARALTTSPECILLDEAVSALDVSIRAQVMNLLREIQDRLGVSYLFIAHDLAVVKYVSTRIGVMYLGKLVETATSDELYAHPLHPYTQMLLTTPCPPIRRDARDPETEERLLAVGRAGTAEHVERIVRGWRQVDRQAEAREAARQHASRTLHVYPDSDGTVIVRARLTPEVGALLVQALAAARETLYQQARARESEADPPTMVQQQADALALLAETALHHGMDPGAPGERYQVVVHVDAEVLANADAPGQSALEDGPRVPAGTCFACTRLGHRRLASPRAGEALARKATA